MSPKLLHMLYVFILIIASFVAFVLILGIGMAGTIDVTLFISAGIFGLLWAVTYIWQLEIKNATSRILFILSGTMIGYNILLSILFFDVTKTGWIFAGTPVLMLVIWYVLMYQCIRKNAVIHRPTWILFMAVLLLYAWDVTSYYYANIISLSL